MGSINGLGRMRLDDLPQYAKQTLRPSLTHQHQLEIIQQLYPKVDSHLSPSISNGSSIATDNYKLPGISVIELKQSQPDVSRCDRSITAVMDHGKWPFCALGLWLPSVALSQERGTQEEGFSTLYSRLAQSCTAKSPSEKWTSFWSSLSTSLSVLPSRDGLFIGCLVSKENVSNALKGILEMVFFPSFGTHSNDTSDDFNRYLEEMTQVRDIEKRQMVENAPDLFLQELCYIQMFGGEGLGNSIFLHQNSNHQHGLFSRLSGRNDAHRLYQDFCQRAVEKISIGISGGDFFPSQFSELLYQSLSTLDQEYSFLQFQKNVGQVADQKTAAGVGANAPPFDQASREDLLSMENSKASWAPVVSGPLFIEDPCFGASLALASANRWCEKVHFMVAMPTGPATLLHSAMIPQAVSASMLGGGSSFSAGGPGKGLYSRLYIELLNRHHWIEDAHALFQSHAIGGWMGIYAAIDREFAQEAMLAVIRQFSRLHLSVSETAWNRAKNRLKSSLLMGMESRLSALESLLRAHALQPSIGLYSDGNGYQTSSQQISIGGEALKYNTNPISDLLTAIDAFSLDEFKMFRNRLISDGRLLPTLVAAGEDLSLFPSYPTTLTIMEEQRFATTTTK